MIGNPDLDRVCTSHVARQNLTVRMQVRGLTCLTNAFSMSWENLWAALRLHFACCSFCRIHRTLRVPPAMEARIFYHTWGSRNYLQHKGFYLFHKPKSMSHVMIC